MMRDTAVSDLSLPTPGYFVSWYHCIDPSVQEKYPPGMLLNVRGVTLNFHDRFVLLLEAGVLEQGGYIEYFGWVHEAVPPTLDVRNVRRVFQ